MDIGLMDVIKNIAVLGLAAYLTTQLPPFRRALSQSQYRLRDKLVLICIFGFFSALGNYLSIPVLGAIANTRIVGAVAGGLLGGPMVGLGAGIIGAIPRYFMGGFTMIPAVITNVIVGYLSGLVYARYGVRNIGVKTALAVSFGAEVILKVMILAFSSSSEAAWELERVIAIPTTVANCLGVMLFVYIVRDVYQEQEKVQAKAAQQAMQVIHKANGVLWSGLTITSAQQVAEIIHSEIEANAVAVTDTEKVLAFIGEGADHHIIGQPFITQATKLARQHRHTVITNDRASIGCPVCSCPLTAVIDAPLLVNNRFQGSIKVYKTGAGIILPYEAELVQGIANFLSLQLLHGELEAKTMLLAQAEYNSLRAQIHPHFMFNTLGTIRAIIRTDPEQARALIKDLSDIIRRHIRPGREMNTIAEEMDFVDSYIRLEQARFGDRIQIIKVIDPEAYDQAVPVFAVQVLVENAVKHGISPKKEGGIIEIRVRREDNIVYISVRDNGVGIAGKSPAHLLEAQPMSQISAGIGIGINNVHARIQRLFGHEFGISIKSGENEGTCVSIRLPWREVASDDADEGRKSCYCR
ncbi:LytS/YhcK type 5TM receptor domain-containing protein [Sporomusa sphaeroides]|jgi:two-component system sensor histidine kinase LytS|uniref:LytS/YhcK type 5TM receptor domain-containing protein n=1 Tax=Sporomusa sphaeroides TaxID=47679 RepID=UPI002CC95A9C|nr:LytS/YhcK type 5TM receptor domain-containing protein [Sporomusa sphaeroides]HML32702.1 LytS/YhcK type 5TM receptor domain-containing protein [Sporomusa sphaeroides]